MEIQIAPYIITQRTEYSKMRLIDMYTGKDITKDNDEILNKILDDYNNQISNPEKYFQIDNCSITGINEELKNIKYLFIPDGIKKINETAFAYNTFRGVSLPYSLEIIDNFAFHNSICLEKLCIPDSVFIIGYSAFKECISLNSIELPQSINKISDKMFYGCVSLQNVVLPDNIEFISNKAFCECLQLATITLPKKLKYLGEEAFNDCKKLEKIDFSNEIEIIAEKCFLNCQALKEAILPDSIQSIYPKAFANCKSLETVKLPKNITTLHREMFSDCINLKNITLPENISVLGGYIFNETKSLKSINIPKNWTYSYENPFGISSIKTLIINHNLEELEIYDGNLAERTDIEKLVISNNVTQINPQVFEDLGERITAIDYLGTKEEFEKLKNKNNKLFSILSNIKEINFLEKSLSEPEIGII